MGYLFQINKMLVEIKENTSGETGANKILVEDCIKRKPHIGEDNSFETILSFCKGLDIIQKFPNKISTVTVERSNLLEVLLRVHALELSIDFDINQLTRFLTTSRRKHSTPLGYLLRARSSAGEHCVDIAGVAGSIPAVPTIPFKDLANK